MADRPRRDLARCPVGTTKAPGFVRGPSRLKLVREMCLDLVSDLLAELVAGLVRPLPLMLRDGLQRGVRAAVDADTGFAVADAGARLRNRCADPDQAECERDGDSGQSGTYHDEAS